MKFVTFANRIFDIKLKVLMSILLYAVDVALLTEKHLQIMLNSDKSLFLISFQQCSRILISINILV